jgi:hypothetical protein
MDGPQVVTEAERQAYAANVTKAYLHAAFTHFQLWIPIWVVYLQEERGLSLTEVTVLDSLFLLTQVATEVPTGAFADRFGRKRRLAQRGEIDVQEAADQLDAVIGEFYALMDSFGCLPDEQSDDQQ